MQTEVVKLLREVMDCAVWQRKHQCKIAIFRLAPLLPTDEFNLIVTGYSNFFHFGEGKKDIDDVCLKLIAKYRSDIPARTFISTNL